MSQKDLFGDHTPEHARHPQSESFELPDAHLVYYPHFYDVNEAARLFQLLQTELTWQQHHIRIAGLLRAQPRLSVWYGDPEAHYSYSGLDLQPLPWHPALRGIKELIEQSTQTRFNSVLANLYRDQNDSMGWHADDEAELGQNPVIASLSLGAPREFLIRHKHLKKARHKIPLGNGSLLLMGGAMQEFWQHAIDKQKHQVGPRINLTFRYIHRLDSRGS